MNTNTKQSTPQSGSIDENDLGLDVRKRLGHYKDHTHVREIDCTLSSLLHKQLIRPTADPTSLRHIVHGVRELNHVDPVAIGDRVRYVKASESRGMITAILPRDSKLSRSAP